MQKIVIATTTCSKIFDTRARLAIETVKSAKKYNYEIIVVDSDSCLELKEGLMREGAVFFEEERAGMGASRRQAMREASKFAGEQGVIVWMEPEKYPLIKELGEASTQVIEGVADVAIFARRSFDSYPEEQAYTEQAANIMIGYLTGHNFDMFFGPKAFNQKALQYFLEYKGDYGDRWDSIIIPGWRAFKAGLRVASVQVDYVHPQEQTTEERGSTDFFKKRIEQLAVMVNAFEKETQAHEK